MEAETIFTAVNFVALSGWLLLLFAPGWKWTANAVLSGTLPVILALAYLCLIVAFFGSSDGGFGSMAGVMQLFTDKWTVLSGWIHYLAFDLFVGSWEVRDSRRKGIPHLLVVPCLIFTFLLGPIGFLLYWIISRIHPRFRRSPVAAGPAGENNA